MELGIERIAEWMRSNRLRLNPEKTDFLLCATRRRCIHLDTDKLSVCGALIRPSTSVHKAPCCVDGRLLLPPAPSHPELDQVAASGGCESGCRRFCHFSGGLLKQPARRSACVPPGRTPVGTQCRRKAHL